ncbi:MAG TPA: PEP-CTERM sorting domain-containing protein, partial [Tepidisphaeraceae bacterium]
NLSLDARRIPNLVWNPARTTGLWDTDPGNRPWLDGTRPSSFENTNNVTFGDAPNDIAVTVDDFGVSPGTMSVTNAAKTYTFTGGPIGGNLAKSGAGTMVLASANQFAQVDVMGGTLRVSGSLGSDAIVTVGSSGTSVATFEAAATQTVKTLTVNNGGVVSVTRGDVSGAPASVLIVGDNLNPAPLTIQTGGTNTGRVDVGTGGLVVDHPTGGDAASLATVRGYIASGYNGAGGGAAVWSGAGIVSSGAAADSSKSVGYALATEVLPFANGATTDTFMGASVDKSSVVVRFTLAGDATLDGAVDFNDLVKLAQNYDIADGSRDWNQGDFTYDGNVDFNDLVKLAQNYNVALPPDGVPGASAAFEADLARAFSAVPEPGSLALLSAIGTMLLPRRRRRD